MKIALFGKTGQVAREVLRMAGSQHDIECFDRTSADFLDPESVETIANSVTCDAIINAVAYTAVDKAESEEAAADTINHKSVAALARAAFHRGIPIVHISTDYVFDGSGTHPRAPGAATSPLGVYGQTKLAGEQAIQASSARHIILRTSWVFSAHGTNFVKTMLRLGEERTELSIVADQIGGPTPATAIADAALAAASALVGGAPSRFYHFTGTPDVSWADFARAIFQMSGQSVKVQDIPTSAYPTPAQRPLNSRLDCSDITNDLGIARPDWRNALKAVLKELENQ